jgi:hypothetical protein
LGPKLSPRAENSIGHELLGLSEGHVEWITGAQRAFLFAALLLFLIGAITPLFYGASITPDGFRAYWISAEKACKAEAPNKPPT